MQKLHNSKIAVIGLGYVGLPLAIEFAKKYTVTGFDINKERIKQLQNGVDTTLETSPAEIKAVLSHQKNKTGLSFSSNIHSIKNSNVYRGSRISSLLSENCVTWPLLTYKCSSSSL